MSSIGSIYDEREREEREALLRNSIHPVKSYGFHDAASPEADEEFTTTISRYTGSSAINYDQREVEIEFKRDKKPIFSKQVLNVIYALLNVFFNVMANVSLPVYAATMDYIKSDAYVLLSQAALWFVIIFFFMTFVLQRAFDSNITFKPTASFKILLIMGTLTTLNGILVVYASPPDRTPPYLQGILMTMTIPYTVICRLLWLRKGLSVSRSLCVMAVMVGLFITAMPQIWGLPGSGAGGSSQINHSTLVRILWPLCFAVGFLPAGIMNVICEKELKKGEGDSLSFITWTQVYQLLTMYLVFWCDFIPGFGMSDSAHQFFDRLHAGWYCLFSSSESCHGLIGKAWLFFIGYSLGNLFNFLLIQHAEGAVYSAVVQAVISPLVALFWTLFKFDVESDRFYWGPKITETTGFVFVGVCILVPGVMLYNHFSIQEEKERKRKVIVNSS